jgi:hypothetical protein
LLAKRWRHNQASGLCGVYLSLVFNVADERNTRSASLLDRFDSSDQTAGVSQQLRTVSGGQLGVDGGKQVAQRDRR